MGFWGSILFFSCDFDGIGHSHVEIELERIAKQNIYIHIKENSIVPCRVDPLVRVRMENLHLALHEKNHYITPYKKNCFFLNIYFSLYYNISVFFYFNLEVEDVFFILMASYLKKKFQRN